MKIRLLISGLLFAATIFGIGSNQASAATGACFFGAGAGGVVNGGGQCSTPSRYGAYGTNDVLTGRSGSGAGEAIPDGVGRAASNDARKREFVDFIKNRFNSGGSQNRVGAAFIIQEVNGLRRWPTAADVASFENRIMNNGSVTLARETHSGIGRTSYYDAGKQNTFYGDHPPVTREVIILRDGGSRLLRIETACGNVVFGTTEVPPPSWNLSANSDVRATAKPGQTVNFRHTVQNNGPDDMGAALDADVMWRNFPTNTSNNNTVARTCNDGNGLDAGSGADSRKECNFNASGTWTIPNGATEGMNFCQQLRYRPDRPGMSGWTDGTRVCVRVVTDDFNIEGSSTVQSTQTACNSVQWVHRVWNIGADRTNVNISGNVNWGPSGATTTGVVSPSYAYDRQIGPNSSDQVIRRHDFTIPCGTPDNTRYCQHITWNRDQPGTPIVPGRSTEACVIVSSTPPVSSNRSVTIIPRVAAPGDVEVTDTARFTGTAEIQGFPSKSAREWGYTEASVQLPSQRLSSYVSRGPVEQGPNEYANNGTPVYYCPSGGSLSGTTCTQTTSGSYTCPSGYSGGGSSSTCSRTDYTSASVSYSCSDPNWSVSGGRCIGGAGNDRGPATATYSCPSGWSRSGTTCSRTTTTSGTFSCPSGYSASGGSCSRSYSASVWYYTCPSGWSGGGSTNQCYRPTYRCAETGGAFSPTYPSGCRTQYTCPGGANVSGAGSNSVWASSQPNCDAWRCQYSDAQQRNQAPQPTCQARCNAGRAPLSTDQNAPGIAPFASAGGYDSAEGSLYNAGDQNCYREPAFTLTCTWSNGFVRTIPNIISNGTHDCNTGSDPNTNNTNMIGQCVEMTLTPSATWQTSGRVLPGRQGGAQVVTWGFNINPRSATNCVRVTGKPYLKVYGDAATGSGVSTGGTCDTGSSGIIRTHNRGASGGYAGSGASVSVLAQGAIDGFASAQSGNASGGLGSVPTALSFASAGTYGGSFGAGPACLDVGAFVANATAASIPNEVSGKQELYIDGDIQIANDIRYTFWSNIMDIPQLKVIVRGNIYIQPGVTQLDGLFVALPNGASGGTIYTCADGSNPVTATWTRCKTQLVVNGALVARSVQLQRDCGTARRAPSFAEPTRYVGVEGDEQFCASGSNGAAEIINYMPELWIGSAFGRSENDQTYDAIINAAPIL